MNDAYDRLLALCVSELALVRDGRLAELEGCRQAREGIIATLPPVPPLSARESLSLALVLTGHIDTELRRRHTEALAAMQGVQHARRTADGYAPPRPRASLVSADA